MCISFLPPRMVRKRVQSTRAVLPYSVSLYILLKIGSLPFSVQTKYLWLSPLPTVGFKTSLCNTSIAHMSLLLCFIVVLVIRQFNYTLLCFSVLTLLIYRQLFSQPVTKSVYWIDNCRMLLLSRLKEEPFCYQCAKTCRNTYIFSARALNIKKIWHRLMMCTV